jgi:hypothetical protein
LTLPVEDQVDK